MSEPQIPDLLKELLTSKERLVWHQVQAGLKTEKPTVEVDPLLLDGIFDRLVHAYRRNLVADEETRQLREDNATLEQQAEAAADIIVGLAKLLSAARQRVKERQE